MRSTGRVIEALGSALAGSDRPLIITSGTGMGSTGPGQIATEENFNPNHPNPRAASEIAGASMLASGVNVQVMRLPQVHDPVKQGLVTYAIDLAREKGVSAYVGDGTNRFPAVHVLEAARLYRLAFEKGSAGARYHAVAEEGVPLRDIAETIGRGLKVPVVSQSPEEAAAPFRLARDVHGSGHAGLQRANTEIAWMASGRAWANFRSRTNALLRSRLIGQTEGLHSMGVFVTSATGFQQADQERLEWHPNRAWVPRRSRPARYLRA